MYLNQACHGLSWLCIAFFLGIKTIYLFGTFMQKKTYAHKNGSRSLAQCQVQTKGTNLQPRKKICKHHMKKASQTIV